MLPGVMKIASILKVHLHLACEMKHISHKPNMKKGKKVYSNPEQYLKTFLVKPLNNDDVLVSWIRKQTKRTGESWIYLLTLNTQFW